MGRVVHFEILVDDPDRASRFYRDALGWEIKTVQGPQSYRLVSTGPNEIPGINGGILGRQFPQAVINTVQVESLKETVARIEKAGGKKVLGPNAVPGVGIHAYCVDTEGAIFGILEPTKG